MGVVRTYEWKLRCTADDAVRFIRTALEQAGFEASVTGMKIDASSKMSWTKNLIFRDVERSGRCGCRRRDGVMDCGDGWIEASRGSW